MRIPFIGRSRGDVDDLLASMAHEGAHVRRKIESASSILKPSEIFVEARKMPVVEELQSPEYRFREVTGPRGCGKSHCFGAAAEGINFGGNKKSGQLALLLNCAEIERRIAPVYNWNLDNFGPIVERLMIISLTIEILNSLRSFGQSKRVKSISDIFERALGLETESGVQNILDVFLSEKDREDPIKKFFASILFNTKTNSENDSEARKKFREILIDQELSSTLEFNTFQKLSDALSDSSVRCIFFFFDDFSEVSVRARERFSVLFDRLITALEAEGIICNIRVATYWAEGVPIYSKRAATASTPIRFEPHAMFFTDEALAENVDRAFGQFMRRIFERRLSFFGLSEGDLFSKEISEGSIDKFYSGLTRISGVNIREMARILQEARSAGAELSLEGLYHFCTRDEDVYRDRLRAEVMRVYYDEETIADFFCRFPRIVENEIVEEFNGSKGCWMLGFRYMICSNKTKRLLKPLVNFGLIYHLSRISIRESGKERQDLDLMAVNEIVRQKVPMELRKTIFSDDEAFLFTRNIEGVHDREILEKMELLEMFLENSMPRSVIEAVT